MAAPDPPMGECSLAFPQTDGPLCSGHGVCDASTNGSCVCTWPWSSFGDFRYQSGVDCDVHLVAIQAIWAVCAVMPLLAALVSARNVWRLVVERGFKSAMRYRGLSVAHVSIIAAALLMAALCLYRTSNPQAGIGMDAAATWLYLASQIGFVFACGFIVEKFFIVSLSQLRKFSPGRSQSLVRTMHKSIPIVATLMITCAALQCAGLAYPEQGLRMLQISYVLIGLGLLPAALLGWTAITLLVRDMEPLAARTASSETTAVVKHLLARFKRLRSQLLITCLSNALVCVLFGCIPWLLRKIAWQYPIVYLTAGLTMLGMAVALAHDSGATTTSVKSVRNASKDSAQHAAVSPIV